MRIVGRRLLAHFWTKNATAKAAIAAWSALAGRESWPDLAAAKAIFGSRVSQAEGGRLAFALHGDDMRLEALVSYGAGLLLVTAIGEMSVTSVFTPHALPAAAPTPYDAYIDYLTSAMDQPVTPDTPEAERLNEVIAKVTTYEKRQWPLVNVEPTAFLMNVMSLTGRTQGDLGIVLGSREKALEILSRKRHLSMSQVHHIAEEWNIPAKMLIGSH